MKLRLRSKISIAFLVISLIMILIIGYSANHFIKKRFEAYTRAKIEEEGRDLAFQIKSAYLADGNTWSHTGIESIGVGAMEKGFLLEILDERGILVWDANSYNHGFCSNLLIEMERNMLKQDPSFEGGYEETRYVLEQNGKKIGVLIMGFYGPYFFSETELKYIRALNELLIGAGILTMFFSVLVGMYVSNRLSMPLMIINENAQKIIQGDYGSHVNLNTSTLEIDELSKTINSLSEALDKQEELRKQLTSDIAHELRTPISTLKSHLELINDGIWLPDEKRLSTLQAEVERIGNLVNDLNKIAQIEKEQLKLSTEPIDLYDIASQAVAAIVGDYYKKGVDLKLVGEPSLIIGDSFKLNQVCLNLLNNALKYTESSGRVILSVRKQTDFVELSVTDTGIGIPESEIPYIFERFYRVDKSRNRESGGVGIGLTITKAIVESHRGNITVESQVNIGTTFRATFPLG